ncbi:hypothetical protein LCGC14_1898260 [marine sediment metagenome]|uniref:C2H2-type domain-containing protein n=1 Tax=marine sediment metagenome TaxID=412755 RepID=A0A0F9IVE8_9ZZZZ
MIKCPKCGKWWSNKKGFNIHYSRMHNQKQEVQVNVNNSQITEILNRIKLLELDNVFMKCQLKHKTFNGKSVKPIEQIKTDEARPERDENKVQFNDVVKELKVMLKSEEPILQKGFRFNDEELGITIVNINQIQMVEVM